MLALLNGDITGFEVLALLIFAILVVKGVGGP